MRRKKAASISREVSHRLFGKNGQKINRFGVFSVQTLDSPKLDLSGYNQAARVGILTAQLACSCLLRQRSLKIGVNYKVSSQIIRAAELLHQKNMLAGADGNISVRLSDHEILITPSGVAKAFLETRDLAVIQLDGSILKGNPSSERLMHLQVYQSCPEAKAVVHAHPPTAIAWSIARPDWRELPADCLSEVILACGQIPFVPYARPGTAQMAERIQSYLPENRAMILSRHGALTWGESLEEALRGMERIEHTSQILASAQKLGGWTSLPSDEVEFLRETRQKIGNRLL